VITTHALFASKVQLLLVVITGDAKQIIAS
jgi:hypothetical protein